MQKAFSHTAGAPVIFNTFFAMAFRKIYDKEKIQDAVFKSEMEHEKELAKELKKFGIDYKPEHFDKFGMTKAKKKSQNYMNKTTKLL